MTTSNGALAMATRNPLTLRAHTNLNVTEEWILLHRNILLACVASVSVRFWSKERGKSAKVRATMTQVKDRGGVGKKGRKRLQTNAGILKTTHLTFHAWVRAPTFDAVISDQKNVWPSVERKRTLEFFVSILSHNAVLHSGCSFSLRCNPFFGCVNHYPRKFNIPQKKKKKKNTNELGPAWKNIAGNHRIPWQKKIAFSYSDPGDTLANKLNGLKSLYSRKKSFAFQKKLNKMLLHRRANLGHQNKQ